MRYIELCLFHSHFHCLHAVGGSHADDVGTLGQSVEAVDAVCYALHRHYLAIGCSHAHTVVVALYAEALSVNSYSQCIAGGCYAGTLLHLEVDGAHFGLARSVGCDDASGVFARSETFEEETCLVGVGHLVAVEVHLVSAVESRSLGCPMHRHIVRGAGHVLGQTVLDIVDAEDAFLVAHALYGHIFSLLRHVHRVVLVVAVGSGVLEQWYEALLLCVGGGVEYIEILEILVVNTLGPEAEHEVALEVQARSDDPVVVGHLVSSPCGEKLIFQVRGDKPYK